MTRLEMSPLLERHLLADPHVQGYLTHKTPSPSYDHPRVLGIVPLKGPRGSRFLMGEVPL